MPYYPQNTIILCFTMLLALFISTLSTTTTAAVAVGTVQSVKGTSIIYRHAGGSAYARPDTPVYEGDMLQTSAGQISLIMTDKSSFTVFPNTKFRIQSYRYNPKARAGDHSVMELVKGRFRFVTGLIGKRNPRRVRYHSGVATMGIRGTAGTITYVDDYYEVAVTEGEVIVTCTPKDKRTPCDYNFSVPVGETAYFKLNSEGKLEPIPPAEYLAAVGSKAKETTQITEDGAESGDVTITPADEGGGVASPSTVP